MPKKEGYGHGKIPKVPDTGPVRSKRRLPLPSGNPTKSGGIFGNPHKRVKGTVGAGNK
jgi:hypothetical protein